MSHAPTLTTEQIDELVGALRDASTFRRLDQLVEALRAAGDKVPFTAVEIDGIAHAAAATEKPIQERPVWHAQTSKRSADGELSRKRGHFFAFEGLDRSGKSTQSRLLAKHLEAGGQRVRWTCFPLRITPIGKLIDLYLKNKLELSDEVIHLLFSANRWEAVGAIIADLASGTSIVCDRYAFSGCAYSSAKGLDLGWCQDPDRGLPTPDAVFYLQVSESVGASRADFGDERYENCALQARVRVQFQAPCLREHVNWHDIDAARDIETIRLEIEASATAVFAKPMAEVPRLWLKHGVALPPGLPPGVVEQVVTPELESRCT
eukprot:NODE_10523_length_1345_cov_9.817734.p1 GENE.NODE_10523_length_1345_cov_9.817734~~NODE_10523_length_1345_cov_9.817734.p1  ORF type:complete len:320 (-),score=63.93 NODE_10523_length_1345_cov_9.817734:301-1260(-)